MRHLKHPLAWAGLAISSLFLAGCAAPEKPTANTYRMGERAKVGQLIYSVIDAQWQAQLGDGSGARVPGSRFLVVRMSVVNSGACESAVPPATVEDSTGGTFAELMDGSGVPQWMGYLRRVKPAETLVGNIVFDAPPHEYRMRLQDETGKNEALVTIPLVFHSDAPELVKPEFPAKEPGERLP